MGTINHKRGPQFKKESERKRNHVMVRLTDEVYGKAVEEAHRNDISISNWIRVLIEEALERAEDRERYGEYDEY